jgi:hypothetical protein
MYCPSCKKPVTSMTTIGEDGKATRLEIADYLMRNECPYCSGPLVVEPEITFREIASTTFVPEKPKPSQFRFIFRTGIEVFLVICLSFVVGIGALLGLLAIAGLFLEVPVYIALPVVIVIGLLIWVGVKVGRLTKAIEEKK